MAIYNKDGYFDFNFAKSQNQPFTIVVGGRGTGKTYGALKDIYLSKKDSLLIRTTNTQNDFITDPEHTPFKKVLDDMGVLYTTKKLSKYMGGVYEASENSDGTYTPERLICRTAGLSTFHNMRGFDGSGISTIIYDEFIEEDGSTSRAGIASTFFNLYETVNRNRELQGQEPVKAYLFGNSNDIFNDILIQLRLISKVCDMLRSGQEMTILKDQGIALFVLQHSPISKKKAQTVLYKAAGKGSFTDMSINNMFRGVDYIQVKKLPLNQLKPVAVCGEICLYKNKSTGNDYISLHRSGTPREMTPAEFTSIYDRIPFEIAFQRGILFDTPEAKVLTKRLYTKIDK